MSEWKKANSIRVRMADGSYRRGRIVGFATYAKTAFIKWRDGSYSNVDTSELLPRSG